MPSLTPPNDIHLKFMPAVLIKSLRSTAALEFYDHIFNLDSMKLTDMQIIVHNEFHGKPEKKYVFAN